ncbi:PEP/pyruvate-binding domain-containing protein [Actinoplanes sp. NBRC 103695]|uniref:PEP/pyruvate-binding domain-containing protein n=1 Tax=Actinoplanes sp. NBRC 103695 TaxID=3032202 RepID=UPI0024A3BE92|nr:PEP/pyruvate-binding domain-containing protein [Actinoplanes sp. NBRC 103695]GLY92880.1 pyruvate, phosphate dikinase [Actinoplanes sp. NBRC 103695]
MLIVSLVEARETGAVGGKAAGLGELVRLGERVPDGFVITTEAMRVGKQSRAAILDAYARLGGGTVAVRSSATAEDQADASFAGQYDSVLGVDGDDALLAAVGKCWASLHGERATAYRSARGLTHDGLHMAVVVQRMVDVEEAGVLFTADPVTGRRNAMLIESARGTGVVDGDADVRRGPAPGDLAAVGERVQRHRGVPQDIEWARDRDGTLWILQARDITTLFPLPPPTPDLRVYLEFGHVQGMLRPATPMGMSTLQRTVAAMVAAIGMRAEIVDIGGRLYGDLTDLARHPAARKRLVRLMAVDFGPRAQAAMEQVLADPRFAPDGRRAPRAAGTIGTAAKVAAGVLSALARPARAGERLFAAVERMRQESAGPADPRMLGPDGGDEAEAITWPIVAGVVASALPVPLLKGLATEAEIRAVLVGLPHNVTIEMDLALWQVAREAAPEHRALLLETPPAELARRYLAGELPSPGVEAFLAAYGHRGVAEADLGVPRWAEDPAPVFAALANLMRVQDPAQAPDERFRRAVEQGTAALEVLAGRVRWWSARGRLAVWLLRRARELAGLREVGKFAGLYRLRAVRERLLLIGGELVADGRLDEPGDVMFLTLDELGAIPVDDVEISSDPAATLAPTQYRGGGGGGRAKAAKFREIVAGRKAVHRSESRRRRVPVALLSDGTDVEATLPGDGGTLRGVGASAGRATGPARVVHDPATARIEPGEVLVAATTDPGWTPLFLTAAAIITETGAIMAHGPTVAREYGLPAVISVPRATERIATGQLVEVDGATGAVTLL